MKTTNLLAMAAIAACFPISAQALTQSFSTNFGPTAVGAAAFNVPLTQFDPSLGTLLSVKLDLVANTSAGLIDFDNEAGSPSSVTLGIGADVTATAPSALAIVATPMQIGSSSVSADTDGAADYIGTDAFGVTGGTGTDNDDDTIFAGFAPYMGLGTFNTSISNAIQTFLSTSGGFGPINPSGGQFDGTVTVTYTYVPEPAALSMLALGGLMAMRRRR